MSVPHYIYKNWDDVEALFFIPIDFLLRWLLPPLFFCVKVILRA